MKRLLVFALCAFLTGSAALAADLYDQDQPILDPAVTAMHEAVMTAELTPLVGSKMTTGSMLQRTWRDRYQNAHESFRIDVMVPIPNEALGINSLADALDADIRATILRHGYQVECMLAVEPVVAKSYVAFAVELVSFDDLVKPVRGVCDVDMYLDGIQIGMPVLHHGDYINSFVRSKPLGEIEFLGGYCD